MARENLSTSGPEYSRRFSVLGPKDYHYYLDLYGKRTTGAFVATIAMLRHTHFIGFADGATGLLRSLSVGAKCVVCDSIGNQYEVERLS